MSQPPRKNPRGGSNSGDSRNRAGGAGSRPGQAPRAGGSRPGAPGSRPPVARQPLYGGRRPQEQEPGFRGTINRVLPPFSAQRYVAIWILGMIPLVLVILWLAQPWKGNSGTASPSGQEAIASMQPGKYVVLETSKGRIIAKLYTDASAGVSKTIANFEGKANAGEFNGRIFHRVEDWVIQGGDPAGTGSGGGTMPSEYNQITFGAGALGVARGGDPALNNDSQFFITKTAANWLDGQYTNWGQVVQGMEVVNQIAIGDTITGMSIVEKK